MRFDAEMRNDAKNALEGRFCVGREIAKQNLHSYALSAAVTFFWNAKMHSYAFFMTISHGGGGMFVVVDKPP